MNPEKTKERVSQVIRSTLEDKGTDSKIKLTSDEYQTGGSTTTSTLSYTDARAPLKNIIEFSVVNGDMNLVSAGDPFAYEVDSRLMDIQVVTLSSPLRRTNRLFDTCGANDRFIGANDRFIGYR